MPKNISLLTAAAVSAPPSVTLATAGTAVPFACDQAIILVTNPAGTGTVTASLRLWGFNVEKGRWYDLGPLNGGAAIPESTTSDLIAYAEGIAGLRPFARLYCEIVGALGGAGTTITVDAACVPCNPVSMA